MIIPGQKAKLEMANGDFKRYIIIIWEVLQVEEQYSERGISVDGTLMKPSVVIIIVVVYFVMEITRYK